MEKIKVGSDFSGVGAFNQALIRLGIDYQEIFACDKDKYARQTFIHNYGEPEYFPTDVYERKIPKESLDIYMTSPPCQAFSLAGKRLGKEDKRGILFFNSHEFIQENKPRFFIFENVKGLFSDDSGKTFSEWINLLGGKSVNGNPVLFPYEDSVPYHIYWKVLNATNFNVPQNRERVFIVGIRDDKDNKFTWPKEKPLIKRLKDILEENVNEKYFLSEQTIDKLIQYDIKQKENGNGFGAKFHNINGTMSALKVGGGGCDDLIKIKSATSKGYEEATEGDSINLEFPESKTRRGRVGKGVAQTLDTGFNQGVICGAIRGRGEKNEQQLELNSEDYTNSITTVQKDNVIVHNCITEAIGRQGSSSEYIDSCKKVYQASRQIRRLTPRECFRLMDFPDSFTWPVSDSQAYKQAGNSIVVACLEGIISKLNL